MYETWHMASSSVLHSAPKAYLIVWKLCTRGMNARVNEELDSKIDMIGPVVDQ